MAGYLPGLVTTRPAVPSSMDPENPQPVPWLDNNVERQNNNAKVSKVRAICACFIGIGIIIIVAVFFYYFPDARYSVSIDSASALDHKSGVSFNLTLTVASRSHGAEACIDPGIYVEVFYRGIQIAASGAAEVRRTCAKPRNVAELPIVARATMLPVGHMQESLTAEMGQGAAVFDLTLYIPYNGRSGMRLSVSDCNGSRVGGAAVSCVPVLTK